MKRTYKILMFLYPRGHRDQFAEEMMRVFEEAAEERRAQGWTWYASFALGEFGGLIRGAAAAWLSPERAAQAAAVRYSNLPWEVAEAQQCVDANIAAMVQAIANHQFERARVLSNQEREARANLTNLREKYGIDDSPGEYQCS
jgi:hypothetical protein